MVEETSSLPDNLVNAILSRLGVGVPVKIANDAILDVAYVLQARGLDVNIIACESVFKSLTAPAPKGSAIVIKISGKTYNSRINIDKASEAGLNMISVRATEAIKNVVKSSNDLNRDFYEDYKKSIDSIVEELAEK